LTHVEGLFRRIDLALELRNEEEREDPKNKNEGAEEDEECPDPDCGRIFKPLDDLHADKADGKPCSAVEPIGNSDVAGISLLFRDEPDELEPNAPPDENGRYAHADEDESEDGE
jgi:hypothetical protein